MLLGRFSISTAAFPGRGEYGAEVGAKAFSPRRAGVDRVSPSDVAIHGRVVTGKRLELLFVPGKAFGHHLDIAPAAFRFHENRELSFSPFAL